MKFNFQKLKKIAQTQIKPIHVGVFSVVVVALFFQNCSHTELAISNASPNKSPLSDNKNASGVVVAQQVQKKIINGVDVPGYEAGAYLYAIVSDSCVIARKTEVMTDGIYLVDPYLKTNFDFSKAPGSYDVSLITVKTTDFISQQAVNDATRLDECVQSLTVSDQYFNIPVTQKSGAGSTNAAWADMNLNSTTLTKLAALNQNQKVNVGVSVFGISNSTGIPFGPNIEGISFNDPNGDGTYFANLIAAPLDSGRGTQRVASSVALITPGVLPSSALNPSSFFAAMKDMVNRGAEVILIPQEIIPESPEFCHPIVGEALFWAVERGATVIVQAGTESQKGLGPSEIVGPRDYSLWQKDRTNHTSCWSRYFRGVISVAGKATGTDDFIANSNWGTEGIELLAPSTNVLGQNHLRQIVKADTPSSGAALTASAVAHIVSFYKAKGWYYSPWLIEDALMNGSRTSSTLPATGKTVRRQKVLDFDTLTTFLTSLNTMTEIQARNIVSDNPEAGQSINLSSVAGGEKPIRLDVFTKVSDAYYKDRTQFQAVYYYASGAVEVVTDQVNWSSNDAANFPVDRNGVVYPTKTGSFTITAVDPQTNMSGTYTASAVDYDRITGQNDEITEIFFDTSPSSNALVRVDATHYNLTGYNFTVKTRARYQSGVVRAITTDASYAFVYSGQPLGSLTETINTDTISFYGFPFYGSVENDMYIFYKGQKFNIKINVSPYQFAGWFFDVTNTFSGYKTTNPPANVVAVSDSYRKIYQGVFYWYPGKVPLCNYADGQMNPCYGYTSLTLGTDFTDQVHSTLYVNTGLASNHKVSALGVYSILNSLNFRGSGVDEVKNLTTQIEVIPVVLTPAMYAIGFDVRSSFTNNIAPSSTHYPNRSQLLPVCYALGYDLRNQNTDLGINDILTQNQGWSYDPAQGSLSLSSNGNDVTSSFSKTVGQMGFMQTSLISPLRIQFKPSSPSGIGLPGSWDSTYQVKTDPNDASFNGGSALDTAYPGVSAPKTLPALPDAKAPSADCSNSVAASGFRRGTGAAADPFLICSFADLYNFSQQSQTGSLYGVLGADLDLSSAVPVLDEYSDGGKSYIPKLFNHNYVLDGANYRIKNVNFVDREANIVVIDMALKNVIFTGNTVIAKTVSFAYGAENVYAYDNSVEATDYRGLAGSGLGQAVKNSYSKNDVKFMTSAYGISAYSAVGSFSQDTFRYIGIVGSGLAIGVAQTAAFSGSAANFTGGSVIGGVAYSYCYKCYSKVVAYSANASIIGGIIADSNQGVGTIEAGQSEAQITSAGNAIVGGVIGRASYSSIITRSIPIGSVSVPVSFSHVHLINSSFTGSLSGSFIVGGLIGASNFYQPPVFTNNTMNGTLSGSAAKIGSYIGQMSLTCNGEQNPVRVRGNTIKSGYSNVGDYFGSAGGVLQNY